MQYHLFAHDGFWQANIEGLVSVDAWDEMLSQLGTAAVAQQAQLLVLDLTGLLGYLGVPERQVVGALLAKHLRAMRKVAMFIQKEKIAGVVEAHARANGLDLKIFPTRDEAVAWIVS
jgi:hypothetical protein